ncbi:MAG: class I SAM-dependent methyltransferase, partial [bacterium]
LQSFYTDVYFTVSYLAERRKKIKKEFYTRQLIKIQRHVRAGSLLDVGCGVGLFMEAAAYNGWDVRGIDVAEFAVQTAQKSFGDRVRIGGFSSSTFEGIYFDLITFWDSLEHLPDPVSTLKSACSRLKENGLLVVKVPNTVKSFFLLTKILKSFGINAEKPIVHLPSHLYHFQPRTIRRLLEFCGFQAVEMNFLNEKRVSESEHYFPVLNLFKRLFFASLKLLNYKESIVVYARRLNNQTAAGNFE